MYGMFCNKFFVCVCVCVLESFWQICLFKKQKQNVQRAHCTGSWKMSFIVKFLEIRPFT